MWPACAGHVVPLCLLVKLCLSMEQSTSMNRIATGDSDHDMLGPLPLPSDTSRVKLVHLLAIALEGYRGWHEQMARLAQRDALEEFLGYAASTVPYYRDSLKTLSNTPDLSDFPLLSRDDLVREGTRMHSENLRNAQVQHRFTGGTTNRKSIRIPRDAVSWYGFDLYGYERWSSSERRIASQLRPGKTGVVHVQNYLHWKEESLFLPGMNLSLLRGRRLGRSPLCDRTLVQFLRTEPVPILSGKPSVLRYLSEIDALIPPDPTTIRPTIILVGGENLHDDEREYLEEWFRCPVYSEYRSTECGLIATECSFKRGHHVMPHTVHLQVLGRDGVARDEGTGELLVTNPANRCVPLVNYRTGDWATVVRTRCDCGFEGQTITELFGKECRAFQLGGRTTESRELARLLEPFPLLRYRVHQRAEKLFIDWVPDANCQDALSVSNAIEALLGSELGATECDVRPVSYSGMQPGIGSKQLRFASRIA